jgi:alkylation response protein AidB-like acyl-CoA dehydrogenase
MDFSLTSEQTAIRESITGLCATFDDQYWLERDRTGEFPHELHRALSQNGWLGICIPEQYGGSGLGITEAAVMMQAISESGAGLSGASAVHMNIFGLNPVVVFANPEQKQRMLPRLAQAKEKAFKTCQTAVMTYGGFGYAKEYHVERYLREIMIPRIAPVSPQLILCFIAEKVLGLPKSY